MVQKERNWGWRMFLLAHRVSWFCLCACHDAFENKILFPMIPKMQSAIKDNRVVISTTTTVVVEEVADEKVHAPMTAVAADQDYVAEGGVATGPPSPFVGIKAAPAPSRPTAVKTANLPKDACRAHDTAKVRSSLASASMLPKGPPCDATEQYKEMKKPIWQRKQSRCTWFNEL